MRRTILNLSAVGFVGFLVGMTVGSKTHDATSQQINEYLDRPALSHTPHDADNTSNLPDDTFGSISTQTTQLSARNHQGAEERSCAEAKEVIANLAAQALKYETKLALTPTQEQLYNDLSQRIETAPYGGLTISELVSEMQMADIPQEYRVKLFDQVSMLINSGKLDLQKFAPTNQ